MQSSGCPPVSRYLEHIIRDTRFSRPSNAFLYGIYAWDSPNLDIFALSNLASKKEHHCADAAYQDE